MVRTRRGNIVQKNPNIEIRNAKQIQNPNLKFSRNHCFGFCALNIRICFELRASFFVLLSYCIQYQETSIQNRSNQVTDLTLLYSEKKYRRQLLPFHFSKNTTA
jgi:hypothetical protein